MSAISRRRGIGYGSSSAPGSPSRWPPTTSVCNGGDCSPTRRASFRSTLPSSVSKTTTIGYQRDLSLDTGLEVEGGWSPHEVSDPAPTPAERCMQAEQYKMLWAAIRHLPAYQRRIMQMYYGERRSYEEIARVTGLATGTVKS